MSELSRLFDGNVVPHMDPSQHMLGARGQMPSTGGVAGATPEQYDAMMMGVYNTTPVGKMQDALGMMPREDGRGFNKSLAQNLQEANYIDALKQAGGLVRPAFPGSSAVDQLTKILPW